MLLTEFDPTPRAVINPDYIKPVENFPETEFALTCVRISSALPGKSSEAET